MSQQVYIAVHAGAGHHSKSSEDLVKLAMKRACTEALHEASIPGTDALTIVQRAIAELEDDEHLNAGYGSNLTMEGTVECDAAIMDGKTGDFGSVGAVSGVKNPIKLAHAILEHSRDADRLGRIRPLTLVSSGAHSFAAKHGLQTVPPEAMVSSRARDDWQKWMDRFSSQLKPEVLQIPQDAMQDTVGAVAWDSDGNMAAGVSSGGLLLKYSGRVGEAATFGAGCWTQQSSDGRMGMACSISGAGEHIMRAGLARSIADALQPEDGQDQTDVDVHEQLMTTVVDRFYYPTLARGDSHPNAGILLLTKEVQEDSDIIPRLWCTFTSDSMAVAYACSEKPIPKVRQRGKILRPS